MALILMSPWVPMMEPKCVNLLDCTCYTCSPDVLTRRISVCTEIMALPHSPWQESRLIKPEKISYGFSNHVDLVSQSRLCFYKLISWMLRLIFHQGSIGLTVSQNNKPLYVNAKSNHPPVVIKHLPMNITERLSSISCNKDEFNKSKPIYAEALKKSGFDGNMSFIDPATTKNKRKRIRKKHHMV